MVKCLFNLNLKSIFVYFFFLSPGFVSSSNQEVINTLDKLHTTIKEISEKRIDKNNINYVNNIISKTYDTKKMSKIILGKFWSDSKAHDKVKFIEKFSLYISSNYISRFRDKKKFSYEYKGIDKIGDEYRIAYTIFKFGETEKLKINYMLIKNQNKWLIFDVLLNGSISEIATKKSEFNESLNNGGITSLISLINKKLGF
tara:strand:+ start:216 stop:815 length:600 start_codon:yes stop_codon:yes gene_type:complete